MPFPAHFLPQQTERLTLRRFIEADLDRFLAYRHDPVVARFQSWSMLSEDEAIAFIHEMSTAPTGVPGEWFQIAIALQPANQLIGDIGIQVSEHDATTVEIGFTLHREEQGKGYAREAIQSLLCSLFELGNITKVIGITDSRNHPSINLLTRLGMKLISSEEIVFRNELCVEQTFELKKEDLLLHTAKEPKPEYILDGRRTTTLEAFCNEVGQVLLAGQPWDENLDGFQAVLRGDYRYLPDSFRLVWREVGCARAALGYDEAVRQLLKQLRDCPPTALIKTAWALRAALRRQGPTVFDWLVDAINKHPNVELVTHSLKHRSLRDSDKLKSRLCEDAIMEVSIEEISQNFLAYLQRVRAGESFVVLQGSKPIAEVIPPKQDVIAGKGAEFLASLEKFQARLRAEGIDLDPDEVFKDVRDRSPAPETPRW